MACHQADPKEEDNLVRALVARRMATPVCEDDLPRDAARRLRAGSLGSARMRWKIA